MALDKPKPMPTPERIAKEVRFSPDDPAFGHASDYSWLIGKIHSVHITGRRWKIRYAPIDEQDRWGGSVVLAEDARIDKFTDGDFVYAEGEIIANRPTIYLAGPLYRIFTIRKLTDQDRTELRAKRLPRTAIQKRRFARPGFSLAHAHASVGMAPCARARH